MGLVRNASSAASAESARTTSCPCARSHLARSARAYVWSSMHRIVATLVRKSSSRRGTFSDLRHIPR